METKTLFLFSVVSILITAVSYTHLDVYKRQGYYVRAVLPDNQISNNLSYFDLRMQPGQSQTLEVEVVNESDKVITVDLAAVSASTNRNGIIDYKTPDIRDETLKIPFSEIAAPEDTSIVIEAHSTAMARITIDMPAEVYDGVVLGGLVSVSYTHLLWGREMKKN